MKAFKLGYQLANDWNFGPQFSIGEFNHSFLHGVGYNLGTLKRFIFGCTK